MTRVLLLGLESETVDYADPMPPRLVDGWKPGCLVQRRTNQNSRADAGGTVGSAGEVAGTAVPGIAGFGFRYRYRHSRRWWLCDRIAVADSAMIVRAPKPGSRGRINREQ